MTPQQEESVLRRCSELIVRLSGARPRGYVAPWWELSPATGELLVKHGFTYDHSQMHRDFAPYYARVGEQWTKIDLSQPAEHGMNPLQHARPVDLVEIPANWYLDDLPPMMFVKSFPTATGSSTRATSRLSGATSSTESIASAGTQSLPSPSTPMSAAGRRCCSCSSA